MNITEVLLTILFAGIVVAMLVPVCAPVKESDHRMTDLSAMKQVAIASMMYVETYDVLAPKSPPWIDALMPFVMNLDTFRCAELNNRWKADVYGHALHKWMVRVNPAKLAAPEREVLFFDSTDLRRSAVAELYLLPPEGRVQRGSKGYNYFAFADGHARLARVGEVPYATGSGK